MRRHVIVFGGLSRFTPISLILTEYISNQKWAFTKRKKTFCSQILALIIIMIYNYPFVTWMIDIKWHFNRNHRKNYKKTMKISENFKNFENCMFQIETRNSQTKTGLSKTGSYLRWPLEGTIIGPSVLSCIPVFTIFKKSKFTF